MTQRALTVITRIKDGEIATLETLLAEIGSHVDDNPYINFSRMGSLHFASWVMITSDPDFPPELILETSYDGDLEGHLDEFLAHGARAVDAIYSRCEGYPPAEQSDQRLIKDYLRVHAVRESTFFVGLPGQTVRGLRNAITVRQEVERFLDACGGSRGFGELSAVQLADRIAKHLQTRAVSPEPSAVTLDAQRAIARRNAVVMVIVGVPVAIVLLPLLALFLGAVRFHELWDQALAPPPPLPIDHRIFSQEDMFVQNHLVTIVKVKPGRFRRWTLKAVMSLFGKFAGAIYRDGDIGGNSTIHFLRTFMMDDDRRVALFSNYDGSWASYLGDFVDQMLLFLNASFGNTEGYPACRWLIRDGARDINAYKEWARERGPYTNVWYSAYRNVTIRNLQKDITLRDGLVDGQRGNSLDALLRLP
jgi:hypothetical protein